MATAGAVLASTTGAGAVPYSATTSRVSADESPFATCTADQRENEQGVSYPNSEVEPWLAVNPANAANLVGGWQQDRWSDGGARGLAVGYSLDGGTTWGRTVLPGITLCSGGEFERATDPWITFDTTGKAFFISLALNRSNPDHALLVSTSTNGGATWGAPTTVHRENAPGVLNDKESITSDPTAPGNVYAVWDRLGQSSPIPVEGVELPVVPRGPTWFARTTDSGATWEPSRPIFDPGFLHQTISNQIVVLPDGTLVNFFVLIDHLAALLGLGGRQVAVLTSKDKGQTWSPPVVVNRLASARVTDPDRGRPVRAGDVVPDIAVDAASGTLYAVWQDARFTGSSANQVVLSSSTDGGRRWSPPVRVNRTPDAVAGRNRQAFTPQVDVADDGTVAVSYYDFRNNTSAPGALTDAWVVHCHPQRSDCAALASWEETRVSPASFDISKAANARGYFLGDYQGLAHAGGRVFSLFAEAVSESDPSTIAFSRLGP